jgi:hypothetical protein
MRLQALLPEEAIRRMKRRNTKEVTWTLSEVTIRWRYIDGKNARNWDGSRAPNPNTTALELMVWRKDQHPRFTNYW